MFWNFFGFRNRRCRGRCRDDYFDGGRYDWRDGFDGFDGRYDRRDGFDGRENGRNEERREDGHGHGRR